MSVVVTYWDDEQQHRTKTFKNADAFEAINGFLNLYGPKFNDPSDGMIPTGSRTVATYAPSSWVNARVSQ